MLIAPGSKFSGTHEDSLHGNSLFAQLVKDARRIRLPLVKVRIKDLRVGSLAAHGVPFLPGVPGDGRGRCGRRFSTCFRAVLLHASVQRNDRALSGPHSRSAAAPVSQGHFPISGAESPRQTFRASASDISLWRGTAHSAARGVRPQRVRATLALQVTTVPSQMAQEVASLHPTMTFSRTASRGSPRSPSRRLSSRISAIASAKLRRASALLKP